MTIVGCACASKYGSLSAVFPVPVQSVSDDQCHWDYEYEVLSLKSLAATGLQTKVRSAFETWFDSLEPAKKGSKQNLHFSVHLFWTQVKVLKVGFQN